MRRVVFGLLGCGLLLGACTTAVGGTALPDEAASRTALRLMAADAGLGDLSTVDPCSLIDRKALRERIQQDVTFSSFDYCILYGKVDGVDVDVYASLDRSGNPFPESRTRSIAGLPGPLRMSEHSGADQVCGTALVGASGRTLATFTARGGDEKVSVPRAKLCEIADAALTAGGGLIAADQVRHLTYQDKSLGKVDPCSMISASEVERITGVVGPETASSASRHYCEYEKVSIEADVVVWPLPDGYQPVTIAGRPSMIVSYEDKHYATITCEVVTAHLDAHPSTREVMSVSVEAVVNQPDPCVAARAIAEIVWTKIPA